MNDPITIGGWPWFLKAFAAVIGAIFALILSGDIDPNGNLKIKFGLVVKLTFSVSISLFGGSAFIEYYHLNDYSAPAQGLVFLLSAVFGILIIGIVYQSLQLMKGKPLNEIIAEVKAAFLSIFK
ncbi:hypothetical protein [Acinetobacter gerneri]|uniref:hypothetical protein n=1 Tax=Acinetobacter gerneri TaxID=202952 RepID=UPI003A88038A